VGEAHLGPRLDGVVQVDRGLGREAADQRISSAEATSKP
jgi:hypothetical protein